MICKTFQHYFKQINLSVPLIIDSIRVRVNFYSSISLSNENLFHFGLFCERYLSFGDSF